MPFRFVLAGLALVLAIASIAAPAAAQEPDRERARAEFGRGVEAYGRADYQVALDAFQEAYRLAPHPNVRVNIANCYEQLHRPIEALFHFEHFLTEAERPPAAQRREVEAAVRRLEQLVGRIQLQITPDGALATIDGTEQRRAPVTEPIRVTAGRHTVAIQMDGYQPEQQSVDVAGGQTARVVVRLRRAEAVAASGTTTTTTTTATTGTTGSTAVATGTAETTTTTTTTTTGAGPTDASETTTAETVAVVEPPVEEEPATSGGGGDFRITLPTIIAGAATIALGIGAGITGGLALSANSDFEANAAYYEDTANPADLREQARVDGEAAASDASTLALVSDVLLASTIVGAGATVFFLIVSQDGGMLDDSRERETASTRGPTFVAVPMVSADVAGVAVAGTF